MWGELLHFNDYYESVSLWTKFLVWMDISAFFVVLIHSVYMRARLGGNIENDTICKFRKWHYSQILCIFSTFIHRLTTKSVSHTSYSYEIDKHAEFVLLLFEYQEVWRSEGRLNLSKFKVILTTGANGRDQDQDHKNWCFIVESQVERRYKREWNNG